MTKEELVKLLKRDDIFRQAAILYDCAYRRVNESDKEIIDIDRFISSLVARIYYNYGGIIPSLSDKELFRLAFSEIYPTLEVKLYQVYEWLK